MACEQTAYVEGIIAASTSESGKLGAIGPIPGDSLVKIINGYEDGAKSVNPDIEVQTAWTNSFVDTQLAQEAAKAMIDNAFAVNPGHVRRNQALCKCLRKRCNDSSC